MLTNWTGSTDSPVWIQPRWPVQLARGLFSFRTHGVSQEPYTSLNIGYHVADNAEHVRINRERIAAVIGGALDDWVVGEQIHGTEVAVVGEGHRGIGAAPGSEPLPGVDALVTNVRNLTLVVMSADCVPVLFFDPEKRVIGAAHSGWKGTVGHITKRVVDTMRQQYGSNPAAIDVWLGPSIRQCCYEVNEIVADPVRQSFGSKYLQRRHGRPDKYLLSLQKCIQADLMDAGILAEHIHDAGVCTGCRTSHLFSHRQEAGRTGRFLGAVRLV